MAILAESVHHCEYDSLATDAGQRLNKIQGHVCLDPLRHR
jgi:hypothetical protein